jgi:hypothetical protein
MLRLLVPQFVQVVVQPGKALAGTTVVLRPVAISLSDPALSLNSLDYAFRPGTMKRALFESLALDWLVLIGCAAKEVVASLGAMGC